MPGDAARFVHIVDDVPELLEAAGGAVRPALIFVLDGFLDAGNATRIAVEHLQESHPGRVVASFDIDAFYDYRARRPAMTFREHHYTDYAAPRLVVRVCSDDLGAPYLLMSGPEPDTHWEAFATAVRHLVEHFDVRFTLALGAVPMAVPHTRPVMITNHATDPKLLLHENPWAGEIRIPSSAQSLLELRLGEWGHDAMGFVAHVPHYVAQFDYPEASLRLLESAETATGLQWDLSALEQRTEERRAEIAQQIEDSDEVRSVVSGLEQQYDSFHTESDTLPLAGDRSLPTADELGAEFERFLAGLDGED